MITVVCFKWRSEGYHTAFTAEHVNVLRRMVARHYARPHRFVCVTDDASGLDPGIDVVPLWDDLGDLPNPTGNGTPSCYRRLKLFARDAAAAFGDRLVCVDLDCVVLGDLTPLWDRPEDLVVWQDPNHDRDRRRYLYCGSMFLLRSGSRPEIWERFDPVDSPRRTFAEQGRIGSDQAWISECLGEGHPAWTAEDGVLSYRRDVLEKGGGRPLPGARIVFFHGPANPWDRLDEHDWVREHWH